MGVGSGHGQWYVQVGVVGHLGWLWLLWGRRGAVAARSGGYGGTTDLEAAACSAAPAFKTIHMHGGCGAATLWTCEGSRFRGRAARRKMDVFRDQLAIF